ncbi:hypothetical protein LJR225_001153 [Phenylobacterium sp. LjRoot225]|uniref:hypothetical protein n=1 Tax=Phenylobacterium sp. LjRoot225 TaxID=3342285 RepID=UPI003ED13DD9
MAKRSIDTLQDTIAAARSAAQHSGAEPRHADLSPADAGRDHLVEARLKPEPGRERVWDVRTAVHRR